mmetsp:Transcript_8034/g.13778  ORF Transcript_8034/g.13778 Transcript_8034/m.13778 type:complete len:224 (-) Transcript_8034:176-847(-)
MTAAMEVMDNESIFRSDCSTSSYRPASENSNSFPYWVEQKLIKWGELENYGSPIDSDRIRLIPMKTPMDKRISDQCFRACKPFTIQMFLERQEALNHKVGLILDLSNHSALYDCEGLNVVRRKLVTEAKVFPSKEKVSEFITVCKIFWDSHPNEFIAVHCSYGFNRTGFLVCSLLVEAFHFSVQGALAIFSECRPPGIKHAHFREELHRRYDSPDPHSTGIQA